MRNLKKILALLTTAAMLAASSAMPVFAAPDPESDDAEEVIEETLDIEEEEEEVDEEIETAEFTLFAEGSSEQSESSVASVTYGETTLYYDTFADALSYANSNADSTLTLLANVEDITSKQEVTGTFTLDLNGKTISGTVSNTNGILYVTGELTLNDSEGGGLVENTVVSTNSQIAGISVYKDAKLTMNAGSVKGLRGMNIRGEVTIAGGTVTGTQGYAVYVNGASSNATLDIKADNADSNVYINGKTYAVYCGGTKSSFDVTGDSYLFMSSGDAYPLTNKTITLSNGRYSSDVTCYCASGKDCISDDTNEDYPYYITDLTEETAGATVTTSEGTVTYYSGITAAVAAASSGDTVTLLGNVVDGGIALETGEKDGITIDLNGYTYTIVTTAGSSGTETNGLQLKAGGSLTIKNGTIKAGKSTVKLLIQNYCNLTLEDVTLDGTYHKNCALVLSCNNGNTVLTGDTNILTYNSSKTAIDVYYWPNGGYSTVSVTIDSNFTGTVDGNITYGSDGSDAGKAGVADYATLTIAAGTITGTITTDELNEYGDCTIIISGGTFTTDDVSAYVVTNYYQDETTGEVVQSSMQVSDYGYYSSDEDGSSVKVTLNDLRKNLEDAEEISNDETGTVKLILTDAPADDVSALNSYFSDKSITLSNDGFAVDISVLKTTSAGETTISDISGQSVTITLPTAVNTDEKTTIYHVKNGTVSEVGNSEDNSDKIIVSGKTVTFTTSSFSTYYIDYTAAQLSTLQITDTVTLNLTPTATNVQGEYYITLDAEDDEYINRFMAAELAFALDTSCDITNIGAVTITPASYIDIIDNGDGEYEFNVNGDENGNGETISDISGASILLGTLTITGDGTFKLLLNDAPTVNTDNQVQTAETSNNIVSTYNVGGTADGELLYNTTALASGKLTLAQSKLIINVMFPNAVTAQCDAYNDMKVTINGVNKTDEVINFGTDTITAGLNATADINGADTSTSAYTGATGYTVTVDDVYQGYSYTLEFTGAGYRTYRMTVVPDGDSATVTVWNNAMSNDMVVVSSDENAMGAVTDDVTFLAGDIVANDLIDLWDLSAVVSYFGKTNDTTTADTFVMYDLNRDGKVDSRDIAMVLVSWDY
ncbi:MAG: dockerin type I domain-containing protein [Firmicutes bacterium]|nr:dockerin type I domain-containing protein [Bacillota bacterium]